MESKIKPNQEREIKSKEKIIQAAIDVFAARGKHGATMEEIAASAGLNKAMVYYYFGSKNNLFRQTLLYIFSQVFQRVLGAGVRDESETADAAAAIERAMRRHFQLISRHPIWARLIFYSLLNEEEDLKWAVSSLRETSPELIPFPFLALVEKGMAENKFRPVDPKQTAVSIAGTNLIYFIGRPIAKILLELDTKEEEAFLKARENHVVDLIFHGLLKPREIIKTKRKIRPQRPKEKGRQ